MNGSSKHHQQGAAAVDDTSASNKGSSGVAGLTASAKKLLHERLLAGVFTPVKRNHCENDDATQSLPKRQRSILDFCRSGGDDANQSPPSPPKRQRSLIDFFGAPKVSNSSM